MAENCKYIKIEGKVNIYKELLKNILIKCKIAKGQLACCSSPPMAKDMRYTICMNEILPFIVAE